MTDPGESHCHKAYVDTSAVAARNPGAFWPAFGRYVLKNLGGG